MKAFAIADNRTAELGAWDEAVLIDLLQEIDLVPQDLGFDDNFFQKLQLPFSKHDLSEDITKQENREIPPSKYTGKITIPLYKPTLVNPPEISSLYNKEKPLLLIEKIKQSSVSEELKDFLIFASYRHTSFSFSKIAEFYAHASEEEQNLFEESALVVIDFQKAIEQGFVKVSREIEALSNAQRDNQGGVDTVDSEEN